MTPVQSVFVIVVALVVGTTLQGCGDSGPACDNNATVVHQLNVHPSELLVDSPMAVRVVSLQANESQPHTDYSGCARADVANGDVGPDGHGTQQYQRLTLRAVSGGGGVPTATVYGVPMNQLLARHGATIVAEAALFGYGSDMGLGLNITALEGSSVTVRNTNPGDVSEAAVMADGATVDLGRLTQSQYARVIITASNNASVTGTVNGSVSTTCSSGGHIAILKEQTNGTVQKVGCGEAPSRPSSMPQPSPLLRGAEPQVV